VGSKLLQLRAFYLSLSALPPCGSMFDDPVEERPLETDIIPGFLAFNPFMAQNLLALSQELLVEHRIFHQLCGVFFRGFHLLFGEFQHLALGVNQNL
jgi:hypothetical protein